MSASISMLPTGRATNGCGRRGSEPTAIAGSARQHPRQGLVQGILPRTRDRGNAARRRRGHLLHASRRELRLSASRPRRVYGDGRRAGVHRKQRAASPSRILYPRRRAQARPQRAASRTLLPFDGARRISTIIRRRTSSRSCRSSRCAGSRPRAGCCSAQPAMARRKRRAAIGSPRALPKCALKARASAHFRAFGHLQYSNNSLSGAGNYHYVMGRLGVTARF